MSTSGSYNPNTEVPCDQTIYTRDELVAIRDAGQLRINCHYRFHGPDIGTTGNTSPTVIELHAVLPDDLSRVASVHTDFDNVAFAGLVNIDAGPNGEINELVDQWNNQVSDEDAGAPTVHTQFPFHMSGPNLRDNKVNDCTLTGWAEAVAAGVVIWDNDLLESGINLTGMSGGQFLRNRLVGSQTIVSSPIVLFTSNDIRNSPVTLNGTSALQQAFQANEVLAGSFEVTAATTGRVTASRNVIGGNGIIGYRTLIDGAGGTVTVSGNRMFNQSSGTQELLIKGNGTSSVAVSSNELTATRISLDGTAGGAQINASKLLGATVTKDPASAGPLTIQNSELGLVTVTIGPANNALANSFLASNVRQGAFTLNGPVAGPGRNDFQGADIGAMAVTVAATATAGVHVQGGFHSGVTINQNRTAGTESTSFYDCDTRGFTTVTDNGTVDPVQAVGFNRCQFRDTVVTINDLAARSAGFAAVAQQLDAIGSTLIIGGLGATGYLDKGRLTGTTLNNGGFAIDTFELLGGSKTLTANQSNRMATPAFDNIQ